MSELSNILAVFSDMISYKLSKTEYMHCQNKCVILAKYFATTIVRNYPSLRKLM